MQKGRRAAKSAALPLLGFRTNLYAFYGGVKLWDKESMEELKSNYKEILSAVTPMKHKIEDMDQLREDVDELKGKPGKTWEDIKSKALGWVVALILAIIAGALGLSKFL